MADNETRSSSTPGWLIAIIVIVGLVVAAFAFGLVNIDQVGTGSMPKVKLETTAGEAPKFDVTTAKIDLGTKQESVNVPTVDVGTKEKTVTVPTISMEPAKDPNAKDK